MRSWVAISTDDYSLASGNGNLDGSGGRLVGVAPEAHVAYEKALEARVQSALENRPPFEVAGGVYVFAPGVSIK